MQKAWKVSPRRFPEGWPSPSCNSFVDTPSPELIHTPIATLTQKPRVGSDEGTPPTHQVDGYGELTRVLIPVETFLVTLLSPL